MERHDWEPIDGTEEWEFITKWETYLHAKGRCKRCGIERDIQAETTY